MWHSMTETSNVSDPVTSDDSGGKLVAVAADTFDLLSAVRHVHSRFNNSTNEPHETGRYAWLSMAAWVAMMAVCEGTCVGVDHCHQSWVDSPVVICCAAVPYHVVQCHIAADELKIILIDLSKVTHVQMPSCQLGGLTTAQHAGRQDAVLCLLCLAAVMHVTPAVCTAVHE